MMVFMTCSGMVKGSSLNICSERVAYCSRCPKDPAPRVHLVPALVLLLRAPSPFRFLRIRTAAANLFLPQATVVRDRLSWPAAELVGTRFSADDVGLSPCGTSLQRTDHST